MSTFCRFVGILFCVALPRLALAQTGEIVITTCDYATVAPALAAVTEGGTLTLDCEGTVEVPAGKPLAISTSIGVRSTSEHGVVFSAASNTRVLVVNANVGFQLANATFLGGKGLGGGLSNQGGQVTLFRVKFISLSGVTDEAGGAIYNGNGGTLSINGSQLSDNSSFGGGGAIYNAADSSVMLSEVNFSGNRSYGDSGGGAIYNNGALVVDRSSFTENDAQGRFGWGGAIYNTGAGQLTVTNSTFAGNTATHSGAALRNDGTAQAEINFSTFVGNRVGVWGGAVYLEGGVLRVSNSLFSENAANGIANDCQQLATISALTISDNLSDGGCGEVAPTGLLPLADSGSPSAAYGLSEDSNAIDAASECPAAAVDQVGTVRPQGGACDIGAVEYIAPVASDLNACQVTTTRQLRLRAEANTSSAILAVVPHNSTFVATQSLPGWYQVTYGTVEGWLSADFVTASGGCGE
ncbi:MAG: choice-of-anchor Q domain-containing protein [Anaerolineae bacterium]